MLASGSEFVDWRHWLLAASMPWPYPTQNQLLNLLHEYKKADRSHSNLISKDTFFTVKFHRFKYKIKKIAQNIKYFKDSALVPYTETANTDRHNNASLLRSTRASRKLLVRSFPGYDSYARRQTRLQNYGMLARAN